MKRNPELEAAIVAAPDELGPRSIYGDWLQEQGDPLGEWAALRIALAVDPNNVAARAAAIELEGEHKKLLYGDGAKAIARMYVGWSGCFVDELRLRAHAGLTVENVRALFLQPTLRFVRHISLGAMPTDLASRICKVLRDAELPLFDELVAYDDPPGVTPWRTLPIIAGLPISRLTLAGVHVKKRMPRLRRLTVVAAATSTLTFAWIAGGGCPSLELLELVEVPDPISEAASANALAAVPHAKVVRIRDESELVERARTGGRAAIRHIPDAARMLATAGETAGDLVGAELRAREALLYSPNHPNLYAIAIDSLRRQGRPEIALELVPKARLAMAKPLGGKHTGGVAACLLECLTLLAETGRDDEAIAMAGKFASLVRDPHRAVLAVLQAKKTR
ncbi:MAG TPA: TIGR02996 domain-containing protein [Kofleriaceae bacterium]